MPIFRQADGAILSSQHLILSGNAYQGEQHRLVEAVFIGGGDRKTVHQARFRHRHRYAPSYQSATHYPFTLPGLVHLRIMFTRPVLG